MANSKTNSPESLRQTLCYEPHPLKFGTSGRRGEVVHLTQLEVYMNALAELEYLQSLPIEQGGILKGDEFFYAYDLRPSSTQRMPDYQGRGEIVQAVDSAIRDAGMQPVNLGQIPTPALSFHAMKQRKGSIMITGSHIPFDRNGYKTNTPLGELLKKDEGPINQQVLAVRERIYNQAFDRSLFDQNGMFKSGAQNLIPDSPAAKVAYIERYVQFFQPGALRGLRVLAYQHSAVGRDILVNILEELGAEVVPFGRSATFVPIDTENMDQEQLANIKKSLVGIKPEGRPFDAIVSTDGDSDRPLILSIKLEKLDKAIAHPDEIQLQFFGGDLLGMIVAEYLRADAVVVPISCNDAIDRGNLKTVLEPRTRIGSPYVIAGMQKAIARQKKRICGWEANGGFLTGSDIERNGRILMALPTRDAMLPILCVLKSMLDKKLHLNQLFEQLPQRYSRAALLKNFPRATSLDMVRRFSPSDERIKTVRYEGSQICAQDENDKKMDLSSQQLSELDERKNALKKVFNAQHGFDEIISINYLDGVRINFANNDVAHFRPSGNADELRIYAVADSQTRANTIASLGVQQPEGLLMKLAQKNG